ncbi:alanine/glycine:cation symporter family protein [Halobacillus sp. ACCC02827]|uniref:alanine/glycine:cation symporter family protein n=1 Tax=Bacillaceae TaxID=186817 RepID=UPI0002A5005B|nr:MULTISPECIES: alanine/glycine:cation symporter family protein [Bacillaceae]ELK47494.1 alanine or glycine/cation symporter (AGCS) family protein [Halobacillus sp. BAB-2008]QHT45245.1 alanine:cation symporter family protein [Bacillus sp. SB49]WJE16024.1 alanine/glycine:cation symporter family protein [Halobacillus sp. ACCC02827]
MLETWNSIKAGIAAISDFLWTYPLAIILIAGGIFLTIRIRFFQFRFFGHILHQTIGQIFKKTKKKGTITPFQAFTSALASTAGATNIVGVPVAISLGGPGALFWMWVVALIGMATKYSEILMGMKYREKNKNNEWVGGPQYYIKKALGWKWVSTAFAFFLMIELIPSAMVQSNSIATQTEGAFGWPVYITGAVMCAAIALVVFGGIKRIAKVTDKMVPGMVLVYVGICLYVIFANIEQIPNVFSLIFTHAFTPISATGGFAGAGIAAALRWGIARGLYSNEAGLGTAPIAHAAAKTDHPSKQAMWGMVSVFVDTIVICTISGLTVLVTGAWREVEGSDASNMINVAIGSEFGDAFGSSFISVFLIFFVITTIGILVFYGEKQAEYLYGLKAAKFMRIVYILAVFVGAIGGLQFVWNFLDLLLAFVLLANIIPLLFLHKEVAALTDDYIDRVYKKRRKKREVELFHEEDAS